MTYASKAEELQRVCLHEHRHLAIAKHFAPESHAWVDVKAARPGSLLGPGADYYVGVCYSDPLRGTPARLLGWAGVAAEMLDADPRVTAEDVMAAVSSGRYALSHSDAKNIGRQRVVDIDNCLSILRTAWPQIKADAANTASVAIDEEEQSAVLGGELKR